MHGSQPGVSRQLKVLQDELGLELFVRDGRVLPQLTPAGQRVLRETQAIRAVSLDARDPARGSLSIATTHTQARYGLPPVIESFRKRYPKVKLHLQQGTSERIAEMLTAGQVDIAISTGARERLSYCILLPCYQWHRRVIVPERNTLARSKTLTLSKLAAYPLVTYVFKMTGPASLPDVFCRRGTRARHRPDGA